MESILDQIPDVQKFEAALARAKCPSCRDEGKLSFDGLPKVVNRGERTYELVNGVTCDHCKVTRKFHVLVPLTWEAAGDVDRSPFKAGWTS